MIHYIEDFDTILGTDWLARHGLRLTTVGVVALVLKRLTQGFRQDSGFYKSSVDDTKRDKIGL